MPLFFNIKQTRPNRLTDKKDKKYHVDFGRWAISAFGDHLHQHFIRNSIINWNFYKGGHRQWMLEEDREAFFLDESGDIRNRIKVTKNLIRPMVEQYVGNAIRLDYDAVAKSESEFVINRREKKLAELEFMQDIHDAVPEFRDVIQENFPVRENMAETEELFNNTFIDRQEKGLNNILKYIEEDIEINDMKVPMAKHMAITGLAVYKGCEQNGRYNGEVIDPMFFFFDRGAQKPDLSDSEYMGDWYYNDIPSIFEKYQNLTTDDRKALENYSQMQSFDMHRIMNNYYNVRSGRIPVYRTYWKDTEEEEYGYVLDDFDYKFFTRINHEESKYTDADLIEPPPKAHQKILNGKKKKKIFVDRLRYCEFVPKEEIGNEAGEDIVLTWGEVPFQEKYRLSPSNVEFPYKCGTWSYDKGEILSPVDDAINPQRFINRMLSVAESHINNSRGSGTVIAKDAVDARDGEESVERNINKSKPIFVDTARTGGVQNSIGSYGSNAPDAGTAGLFNIMKEMQISMQDITGINEAMTGTQGASGALVGVLEQQIQRGTLIQEPFYWALTNILKQAYQNMMTVGKRVYAAHPRRLAIITGDGIAQQIEITQDMLLEDQRIFIQRTTSEESRVLNANDMIINMLQLGLLDPKRGANLFNRSTADDVADAMREHQMDLDEAQRAQQAGDAQRIQAVVEQEQAVTQQQGAERAEDNIRDDIKFEKANEQRLDEINLRGEKQKERDREKSRLSRQEA